MRRHCIISVVLALSALVAMGQNVSDLVVSEALPLNGNGIVDDFGRHSPWIELTNTSQGTVNFAGCFLTDDPAEPRKYMIPKGDASTKLGPRQVTILWCNGNSGEGTYYTNFTLVPGSTVYLVSNDGKTVIDSITVPSDIPEDMSVSKFASDPKGLDFETADSPTAPTPRTMNRTGDVETGAQRMANTDPNGWILTVTSVTVVFAALVILWWIFTFIGKLFTREKKPKAAKAVAAGNADEATAAVIAMALDMEQGGGTYAAIAAALHLYLGETAHDSESYIITIRPSEVTHHNFRKLPRRYGTV